MTTQKSLVSSNKMHKSQTKNGLYGKLHSSQCTMLYCVLCTSSWFAFLGSVFAHPSHLRLVFLHLAGDIQHAPWLLRASAVFYLLMVVSFFRSEHVKYTFCRVRDFSVWLIRSDRFGLTDSVWTASVLAGFGLGRFGLGCFGLETDISFGLRKLAKILHFHNANVLKSTRSCFF